MAGTGPVVRAGILKGAELSPLPQRTPLNAQTHSRRRHKGYTVENVAIESVPGFFVTGNLYRPHPVPKSMAVVLCPHGHHKEGRYRDQQQIRAATMARMGALVFSSSMLGNNDATQVDHQVPHALTLQLWNSFCALDFLLSVDGADPRRVGMSGSSGGGT